MFYRRSLCALLLSAWIVTPSGRPAYGQAVHAPADPAQPPGGNAPNTPPATADAAEPPAEAVPSVEPPSLLQFAEATYPTAALADQQEGQVVLTLTIDATGQVTAAEVTTAAGHGFDAAAQQAALQFRFSPAKRNGVAVPARIRYTYEFQLPEPAATGAVHGRVTLSGSGSTPRAAAGVEVQLRDAGGQQFSTRTDLQGRFVLEALPPGSYQLQAHAEGLGAAELTIAVAAGESSTPSLRLLPPAAQAPLEVTVHGQSTAERLRRSAQAVQVVETEAAQRQTADLGEVLARSQGIGVRRGGGLGSATRISLNGLVDDQIRFFYDGIPFEFSGYPFGIANVPVNLVDRVEVYRGVVPIRFGADALGGAVNLVSDDEVTGTHGSAAYQTGAFGTQRLALSARHLHEPSGFFTRVQGFADYADNDYPIDVEERIGDSTVPTPARAYRFHDAYRAVGGSAEVGFVEQPWAKRLLLRTFITDYDKELPHNITMATPYGDVTSGELTTGATVRYENRLAERFTVEVASGYAYTGTEFTDDGDCIYNWFGQCTRERKQLGEIETPERELHLREHSLFGRLNLGWQLNTQHGVRLTVTGSYATRTGEDKRYDASTTPDPLAAKRNLFTLVGGVEYQVNLFGGRLENILFAKGYFQQLRSQEQLVSGVFRDRNRDTQRVGVGNALRYRFVEWLYAKVSYERATRLPRVDEIFGNGALVVANLGLEPEESHNVYLTLTFDAPDTALGAWRVNLNGFLREADQLIVRLGDNKVLTYKNVYGARSLGFEGALGWTSKGDLVALDGNLTYLDFRNTSSDGNFADNEGDRIPNRPYLFANGSARIQLHAVASAQDKLILSWSSRYVHEFFPGWESQGLAALKEPVPSQLLHALALTYLIPGNPLALSFTGEVQNLTDRPAYDFFRVQRPGRAFYFKTTAEF